MKKICLLVFILVMSALCMISCEEEHACSFNRAVRSEEYKVSDATCTQSAVYYLSCSCGKTGRATFADGTYSAHVYNKKVEIPAYLSEVGGTSYFYSCVCGARGEEVFSSGTASGEDPDTASPVMPEPSNEHDEQIDITNYALIIKEIYQDKGISDTHHGFINWSGRSVTHPCVFDRTKPMYFGTVGTCQVDFYDADMKWIEKKQGYFNSPILANTYHQDAKYVCFSFDSASSNLLGDAFYVSTVDNYIFSKLYSRTLKRKNVRPRIDIYLTDSEEDILIKMVDAWFTQDCDVYWEHGEYSFDEIYKLFNSKYGKNVGGYEIPIGGNCRYFFNGSTIYATNTILGDTAAVTCIFGSQRRTGSYELHDGYLIGESIIYVVHDEASGSDVPYVRKYHNMKMKNIIGARSTNLSKCIGGGTGRYAEVIIENCQFFMEGTPPNTTIYQEVSYHGINTSSYDEAYFRLSVHGCYFQHTLGLHGLGANQTAECIFANNSCTVLPTEGKWQLLTYANEERE